MADQDVIEGSATSYGTIKASIDTAFAPLIDFAGWKKWCDQFDYMNAVNDKHLIGQIREYKMLPSNSVYQDQLTAVDSKHYSITYTLLTSEPALKGLISSVTTVSLETIGENQTKITWSSKSKTTGLSQQVVDAIHVAQQKGYDGHIKSLTAYVEAQQITEGSATSYGTINGPIDVAFAPLINFAGWKSWCNDQFDYMNAVNDKHLIGQIREYKMLPSNSVYQDQLIAVDSKNYSISYSLLYMQPALKGLVSSVTTVSLESVSDKQTKITWSSKSKTYGLPQQVTDAIHASQQKGYDGHIHALATYVESLQITEGSATSHGTAQASIDVVFAPLIAFAGWKNWCNDQFEYMNAVNDQHLIGQIREYKMLPSNSVYQDQLIAVDSKNYSITYSLLYMQPALKGLVSSVTTVSLERIADDLTKINWTSKSKTFGLPQQVTDAIHVSQQKGYDGHIKALVTYAESLQITEGSATSHGTINGPIDAAFAPLIDFAGWKKWCDQFGYMDAVNDKHLIGQIREYEMLPSHSVYQDQLIAVDSKNYSIKYSLLYMQPALKGLVSSVTTVHLERICDNQTKITWTSKSKTFGLPQQVIDAIHVSQQKGYDGHIQSLAKYVESLQITEGTATSYGTIQASIDAAFVPLTDFSEWKKWCDQFDYMISIDKEGIGEIREYKMLPSNSVYQDQFIHADVVNYSITYSLLYMQPALKGLISSVTTVSLESVGENQTKITWSSKSKTFGLPQQVIDAIHVSQQKGYDGHIKSLTTYVESQQVNGV